MVGWASAIVLVLPYLAGVFGGVLLVRAAPAPAAELAPLWGFASGAATGCVTGIIAAFSGGPLGSGRLVAVGPSAWQSAVVATLEVGVAAAISAGAANWLYLRRHPVPAADGAGARLPRQPIEDEGHRIYLNPWAGADNGTESDGTHPPVGPSSLP